MSGKSLTLDVYDRIHGDTELSEEASECRNNGYILTGKFLGQGAYAKVYLGQAIPEKIPSNAKLRRMCNQHKGIKVRVNVKTFIPLKLLNIW